MSGVLIHKGRLVHEGWWDEQVHEYVRKNDHDDRIASLERELAEAKTRTNNFLAAVDAKQAKIDALMLEFCPGEMSAEQKADWAAAQVPASASERAAIDQARKG